MSRYWTPATVMWRAWERDGERQTEGQREAGGEGAEKRAVVKHSYSESHGDAQTRSFSLLPAAAAAASVVTAPTNVSKRQAPSSLLFSPLYCSRRPRFCAARIYQPGAAGQDWRWSALRNPIDTRSIQHERSAVRLFILLIRRINMIEIIGVCPRCQMTARCRLLSLQPWFWRGQTKPIGTFLLQAFSESVLVAVIAATDEHLSADGQHCEQHGRAQ